MNSELEQVNSKNEKESIPSGFENGKIDPFPLECKLEVLSDSEDKIHQTKQHVNINFLDIAVKEENADPKGTTQDESMAVEALRQLGGMYESMPIPNPPPAPFRQHICNICGETFERKTDLGNHIVCHQVDRPHACRICGNLFRRKADLQNHMVCHQVERPHRCSQCGADFQRPSSLTNHMKIHTYSPGRALGPIIPPLPNYQDFPPTTTSQPVCDKVPAIQIPSYNGWNVRYLYSSDSGTDGNVIPVNQPLETAVPRSNHDLNYQSTSSKQYSQVTDVSEDISQFSYTGNSGPVIESVQTLQGQQCSTATHTNPVQITTEDQACRVDSYENVTPVDDIAKNSDVNLNSVEYRETAVKVEEIPYIPTVENANNSPSAEDSYTCPTNEQSLPSPETNRRPHVCRHCGLGFIREKALQSHERLHQDHWGSPVECVRCEEMFPEELSLRHHQVTCVGKISSTPQQQEQLPENQQQEQHRQQIGKFNHMGPVPHHSNMNPMHPAKVGKHACKECEKRFSTKQKLFRHLWIHRKRPHVCEICGLSLADLGALDDHRRSEHPGDARITCNECGKSFASRQGLWEHSRLHAGSGAPGISPFLCQRCGKCFASRQGHLIHTRTHTGERPYGCRFCWKAFRDGGTLRKHERIHTGERPHVCPLCPRAFNQKVVLREHVRWVHAARNSDGCPLCGCVIGDREALCAHIVKHSDELAAAAKAAKGKQDVPTNDTQQNITNRVDPLASSQQSNTNTIIPVAELPVNSYPSTTNFNFLPQNGLRSESVDTNMNNEVLPIKSEFSCDMCGECFKVRTELLNHVRIHI